MFRIGEFSRLSRVPVSALRYYADLGLLDPEWVDPESGYRYFGAAQLPRLNRLLILRDMGLSLEQIGVVLDEGIDAGELREMLRRKEAELRGRVTEEQERLDAVAARLRFIEKEGAMPDMEIVVKEIEAVEGLGVRDTVPAIDQIGGLIQDAFAGMGPALGNLTGPPMAVYYDEEFTGADVDVEMVFPTSGAQEPRRTPAGRNLAGTRVAGGSMAALVFVGPYEQIGEAYQAMGTWLEEHGRRIAGPVCELYLTDPNQPGPPVTEIRMPIREA
jgi:DNA-binding transcriptional MerR regulator